MINNAYTNSSNVLLSMKHLNIVLAGKTGFGKSTLLNQFLCLNNSKWAKTGKGKPITLGKPQAYESDLIPAFRL